MFVFRLLLSRAQALPIGLLVAALTIAAATTTRVSAAEMVMFESTACVWCEAWHEDIGVIYSKTTESETLPLRLVDVDDDRPEDLDHIEGIIYTPTFIILDKGKEIGRILGYPGEDFFWQLLADFISKIKKTQASKL